MPRWFAAFALALVAVGVAGLSGSSWLHGERADPLFSEGERQQELWGTSRGIRSDEWAVETPEARAQQLAGFPLVNLNEGLGEMQRNTYEIPVFDWGLVFRPMTWPYLLGSRWSHALRWFLREALLLIGLYALLSAVVDDKRAAAIAAAALFFSSAFAWWRSTVMLGFVGWISLTAGIAARATERRTLGWFALTAYCAACSFCIFYPPVWAPMLWVGCALAVDVAWRRRRLLDAVLPIGLIACGSAVGIFYHLPYLSLVADTVYPGRRIASAGEVSPARLIEMVWPSLTVAAPVHCGVERYLGVVQTNVCEASSIEVLPAAVLVAMALASARVRRSFAALVRTSPATLAAFAILCAWLFLPLPQWFGSVTLLRWSPGPRAWIAFGISTGLLVAKVLASLRADPDGEALRWRALVPALAVAVCAAAAVSHIRLDPLRGCFARAWVPPMVLGALVLAVGGALLGRRAGATALLGGWLATVALANHRVDPIVHSSQLFARGTGHDVVEQALRKSPGRIAEFDTHPGAQLSAFGWPLLGGVQNSPDVALFRFLAPESVGLSDDVYNRYAHHHFVLPPAQTRVISGDDIRVAMDPCSRRLVALGVNHLLTASGATLPERCSGDWISQLAGRVRLWSRKTPVCMIGVARGAVESPLEFDYTCGPEARLRPGVSALVIEAPADPSRSWAVAVNPAVIGTLDCTAGSARFVDAHLLVRPDGTGPAVCVARYLDSTAALRRLLKKW